MDGHELRAEGGAEEDGPVKDSLLLLGAESSGVAGPDLPPGAAACLSDDEVSDSTLCGASTAANSVLPSSVQLDRRTVAGVSTVSTSGDAGACSDAASDAATATGTVAGTEGGGSRKAGFMTVADPAAGLGVALVEGLPGLRALQVPGQGSGGSAPQDEEEEAKGTMALGSPVSAGGVASSSSEAKAQHAEVGSGMAAKPQPVAAHAPAVPPLHKAASEGDNEAVLKLLMQGVDPNEEDALLGETPLFEAAAVDAAVAVGLLLLFGADAKRRGRHTKAIASEFAPAGGATAELLGAWERGDFLQLAKVLTPLLKSLVDRGFPQADQVMARMQSLQAQTARTTPPRVAGSRVAVSSQEAACHMQSVMQFSPVVFGDFTNWVPDVAEGLPTPSSGIRDLLESLHARRASKDTGLGERRRFFSPGSDAAEAVWATVAAYEPQMTLSVMPVTCTAMAELILGGDPSNAAWCHATSCIAPDVVARDRRRRGPDGQPVSWRSTFQELVTQRVYCWGTDGIITGCGARAPVKLYSRPRPLLLEPDSQSSSAARRRRPRSGSQAEKAAFPQPFVRDIACGRRHSAAVTFSGSVYVWGRDVAPPVPPPEEAMAGIEAWTAWRATQSRLATSADRPRRLVLSRELTATTTTPPLPYDEDELVGDARVVRAGGGEEAPFDVVGISATSSVTLLRLSDGQTVCTGGWTAQEAQLRERTADAVEARRRGPRLPPLRKITRGFCFNVALSRDGRVFVWRHSGLVPTGIIDTVPVEPTSILPPGDLAADIAVGEGHVLILTEMGRVWSFGWRQLSALGRGPRLSTSSAIVPMMISGLERIVQIAAGATYSLCVDIDGSLWLFGEGPCITGCFNHPTSVHEPRRVPSSVFGGRCVLSAACGDGHVLALTAWDPCHRLLQPGAWFADADRNNMACVDGAQDIVVGEWMP